MKLEIEQHAFDSTDQYEQSLFMIELDFEPHIHFTIEADFDEDPAYWHIAYGYLNVPLLGINEEILMESSITETISQEALDTLLNTPVTRWTW